MALLYLDWRCSGEATLIGKFAPRLEAQQIVDLLNHLHLDWRCNLVWILRLGWRRIAERMMCSIERHCVHGGWRLRLKWRLRLLLAFRTQRLDLVEVMSWTWDWNVAPELGQKSVPTSNSHNFLSRKICCAILDFSEMTAWRSCTPNRVFSFGTWQIGQK